MFDHKKPERRLWPEIRGARQFGFAALRVCRKDGLSLADGRRQGRSHAPQSNKRGFRSAVVTLPRQQFDGAIGPGLNCALARVFFF